MDSAENSPGPPLTPEPESISSDDRARQSLSLGTSEPVATRTSTSDLRSRLTALLEVLICSDYPTQFALAATFAAFGFSPEADGGLSLTYIVVLSLVDTAFLVGLILMFVRAHGESARELFFGGRPIGEELRRGGGLIFVALLIAAAAMLSIQALAPALHNVEHNPLQDMIKTPAQTVLFAIVVVIAGGVREELQ